MIAFIGLPVAMLLAAVFPHPLGDSGLAIGGWATLLAFGWLAWAWFAT